MGDEPQAEAEALRLKDLAEQKYNSGDLKSAVKYAKRASQLHATADGLSEMLTAFEILTIPPPSGTSTLPDYYKILEIEPFSHINTIKKQYRKLALTLHPDKNPFIASEEAFKLVGQAFRVLSDKVKRKEYDVKLRLAMQSAAMAETGNTTTFSTVCSACGLLHHFEAKYLGHNLICPSCKNSFEAVEEDVGLGLRVSARIKARKRSIDGGTEAKRAVRETEQDIDSDDDCLIQGLRSRTKGEETMTLAQMQMLVKKKKKKVNNEKEQTNEAMKFNSTEKDDEERNEMHLSLMEEEDEEEMNMLIARVREKRFGREKVSKEKGKGQEQEENNNAMQFNLTEKGSEKRKEFDLSLIEEEEEAEMETLIARVREKRIAREKVNEEKVAGKAMGQEKEENNKAVQLNATERDIEKREELGLSLIEEETEMETLIARVRDKRIAREKVNEEKVVGKRKGQEKEENNKAVQFNATEKRKELDLSLIEEEEEAEMETPIARVKEKRVRREKVNNEKVVGKEKGGEKEENNKVMKFISAEKESEKRKVMHLSLIEEEDEAEMDTLIARVREKRIRREKVNKEKVSGEEKVENNKAMQSNSLCLSLIEEEDEAEMDTLIGRVREKRVRRETLKRDGLVDGRRIMDLSSKRGGKSSKQDDLEIIAVESPVLCDFDKDRVERSFKKGQVWAVYDDDGMPRDYALIDEVISVHPFEVRLNWLEFQSNTDEALVQWGKTGFHISCGKFKVSRQVVFKSLKKFSHVVDSERAARELYRIYPSKGSIWALYKENDVGAGSRNYDIVVSLSSYSDVHGVSIAYLEKVDELRTIFKRREIGAHAVRLLGKDELRLFSHRIPARKLPDEEASYIGKDCWELDPASLPHEVLANSSRS